MTHRERVIPTYEGGAVVDPYVGGLLSCAIERKLWPLIERGL